MASLIHDIDISISGEYCEHNPKFRHTYMYMKTDS